MASNETSVPKVSPLADGGSEASLDHASRLIARVVDQGKDLAEQGASNLRDTAHLMRLQAELRHQEVLHYVRREPIKSLLISATAGAALVLLFNAVRRLTKS